MEWRTEPRSGQGTAGETEDCIKEVAEFYDLRTRGDISSGHLNNAQGTRWSFHVPVGTSSQDVQ